MCGEVPPNPPNTVLSTSPGPSNLTVGAIATYDCVYSDGVFYTGTHVFACMADGQWSLDTGECRAGREYNDHFSDKFPLINYRLN